jgi:hypothetical protein
MIIIVNEADLADAWEFGHVHVVALEQVQIFQLLD